MSDAMGRVASAALPVAVGLLALAAVARSVLWARFGDAHAQRTARRHREPLSVWCLGALGVYVFARSASGSSWASSLGLGAALGAATLGLWLGHPERTQSAEPAPAGRAEPPAPAHPATDRPLWPDPAEGTPPPRLWGRG